MEALLHTLNERDAQLRSAMQSSEIDQLLALLARVRKTADALTLREESFCEQARVIPQEMIG
jgi:hypothetical protein